MEKAIGLSSFNLQECMTVEEIIDFYDSIDVRYIDLSLGMESIGREGSVYQRMDLDGVAEHYTRIREYADSRGVKFCQTHGRGEGYSLDEQHNCQELANMERDLIATRALGAPYCVVHGVHLGLDAAPEEQRRVNHRMFTDYLPLAKRYGVPLADETLGDTRTPDGRYGVDFFGDLGEFTAAHERLWALDDYRDWLYVCMDTGHTNKVYRFPNKPSPAEFIRRTGNVIRCLHLHDNDKMTDQHKVPKSGCINWSQVLAALREIGYNGVYNMEVNLQHYGRSKDMMLAYAAFSAKVMREMLR